MKKLLLINHHIFDDLRHCRWAPCCVHSASFSFGGEGFGEGGLKSSFFRSVFSSDLMDFSAWGNLLLTARLWDWPREGAALFFLFWRITFYLTNWIWFDQLHLIRVFFNYVTFGRFYEFIVFKFDLGKTSCMRAIHLPCFW